MSGEKTLLIVVGPTAIGKTAEAIRLARAFDTEILSADSRQFYRNMHIGTARPSEEELAAAPHHFIGFLPLEARFSAGDFARAARAKAKEIFQTKDLVIAVGGSGLYLKALTEGFDDLPHEPTIRQQVIDLHREKGLEALTAQLQSLDAAYCQKADMQNTQRVMRALEVCLASGRPYSSFLKGQKEELPWRVLWLGLSDEREIIYEHINRRVDAMVEAGLEVEAHRLLPFRHLNSLRTVGYSEWFVHFDGLCTHDEAIEQIKQNTRRFAKRQLTWFKANPDIRWFRPGETDTIDAWLNGELTM